MLSCTTSSATRAKSLAKSISTQFHVNTNYRGRKIEIDVRSQSVVCGRIIRKLNAVKR